MKTGFEVFIEDQKKRAALQNQRVAYLGNHASVNSQLIHSLDVLKDQNDLQLTCLFSPQHGWQGAEQANMIESHHTVVQNLPVFSLYTHKTRKMTSDQLNHFDVLLIDLQDVGCRVYTFVTTMIYALHSCAKNNKSLWILDRPNPVGRQIEGSLVQDDFRSVVGAWKYPMRYGLTMGELAKMYVSLEKLKIDLNVVLMENYNPYEGWPESRTWISPSPNMTGVECARCYSGTVLLEGTHFSEGRGTTAPLKIFGFPNMRTPEILSFMNHECPSIFDGCKVRSCFFKPTFDKFKDQSCSALQFHADNHHYHEDLFRPYRIMSLFLKAVRTVHSDYDWLLPPPYEYEYEKWPIDLLSGDSFLREWIQNSNAIYSDLDEKLSKSEKQWKECIQPFYIY